MDDIEFSDDAVLESDASFPAGPYTSDLTFPDDCVLEIPLPDSFAF